MREIFWRAWEMLKEMDKRILSMSIILTFSAIGAGFSMIGGFGPAIGTGYATGSASESSAKYPENRSNIISTLVLGSAIAGSTGIYSLVIALILLFANPLIGEVVKLIGSIN